MSRKAYLTLVEIHEGQFSSEKAVVIANYDGDKYSGFFQNEHIRGVN